MKLPKRWLKYEKSARINGTRFVAFKVPLKEGYNRALSASKSFVPSEILESYPKLKMVIDLTYTTKFYDGKKEFERKGVQYIKIYCKGGEIPNQNILEQFYRSVDNFIAENPDEDFLIGIHCTHGVNRTGYLIARYMIERLGYTPDRALEEFFLSRGHAIERTNYIEDLKRLEPIQDGGFRYEEANSNPSSLPYQTIAFNGVGLSPTYATVHSREYDCSLHLCTYRNTLPLNSFIILFLFVRLPPSI